MEKQGWTTNIPNADTIVEQWKPKENAEYSASTRRKVCSQIWKGLKVTDIVVKGKGVMATRQFKSGEIVCDYHGVIMTHEQGEAIHLSTTESETGYVMFYRNSKGEKMAIDAHTPTCPCHPDVLTKGRLINHEKSLKKANLRPFYYELDFDGKPKDVILFKAVRDIQSGEEMLFNYGVNNKQFGGEALNLSWL